MVRMHRVINPLADWPSLRFGMQVKQNYPPLLPGFRLGTQAQGVLHQLGGVEMFKQCRLQRQSVP